MATQASLVRDRVRRGHVRQGWTHPVPVERLKGIGSLGLGAPGYRASVGAGEAAT